MPASTSRSPSPVTAPPVAAAPGPRAAALQKLYNDAIAHTLKTCNYPNFASCFPTPAKYTPDAMKDLHGEFVRTLDRKCKEHFDQVLEERDVVASLNELDRLVDEARKRRNKARELATDGQPVQSPVPPHTLPASALYLAHLAPSLREQQAALDARLNTAQNESAQILDSVLQQRREIEQLVAGLETVIADIDASNLALPSDHLMAFTEEAVSLDTDLRKKG